MRHATVLWLAFFAIAMGRFAIGHHRYDTVWGEDGVFLSDVLHHGWRSFDDGQAGYLHVVPRMLALIVSCLPATLVPMGFIVLSLMVTAFVAVMATRVTRELIPTEWSRLFLGFAVVALPVAGAEALGNVANLQQWLWFGALLCTIGVFATRWERISGTTLLVAAGLSSPLAALLVPLVVWKRRHDRVTTALFLAAVSFHLLKALSFGDQRTNSPIGDKSPYYQIKSFLVWVPNGITAKDEGGWSAIGITFVVIVGVLAWTCRKRFSIDVWSIIVITMAYWFVSTGFGQGVMYRHRLVPGLLVILLITIIAQSSPWLKPFVFALTVLWVTLLGVWGPRLWGPSWTNTARHAPACDTTYALPIAPGDWGEVLWPCDRM